MKQHAEFMRMAVARTREGIALGQSPFGACIVRDGEVIACEHNVVWAETDITAHAEVHAIRVACRRLGAVKLEGCVLYATTEPCPMCFSAIHWAGIGVIHFGTSIADAAGAGFGELAIRNETMKQAGGSPIAIHPGLLREECAALFAEWRTRPDRRAY